MQYQRTVAERIELRGEGIFTGKEILVEIFPAEENTGIVFVRADLKRMPKIKVGSDTVIGLEGATAVTDGTHIVYLVEHLLSALHAMGIDNAEIRVHGEEIPIFDGSAYKWVRAIQEVGYKFCFTPKKFFRVKEEFLLKNGKGFIHFKPSNKLLIKAEIQFDHPLIGHQIFEIEVTPRSYINEICFARTFGFKEFIQEKIKQGALKGGSLENAIILDEKGVLNPDGLRCSDEFVRHKVLDIIGDLYALGIPFQAEVHAYCSGHRLHIEALKTLYREGLLEEVEAQSLTFVVIPKMALR